jgi:hypothetical protein
VWGSQEDPNVKYLLPLIFLLLGFPVGWAQTPTLIQTAYCPNSGPPNSEGNSAGGAVTNGVYTCRLPSATLAGDFILVSVFFQGGTGQTLTLTDSASNSYSQDVTNTTSGNNIQRIYHLANAGAGITYLRGSFSGGSATGYVNIIFSEWNNVATSSPLDVAHCNSGSSTSITAGAAAIGTANDLLVQHVFSDDHQAVSSFTAGSQANTAWRFGASDLNDAAGFQFGVYSSTGSFNPTFTQGTSHSFASCFAAFKTAASGATPSGNRPLMISHAQVPPVGVSAIHLQVPFSGNLQVLSFLGGYESITKIASTPSCTWTSTGPVHHSAAPDNYTQIFYAMNCVGNAVAMTLSLSGNAQGDTVMVYDITGPNSWAFDTDSGGQDGDAGVSSLTTCSSCLTPTTSNGVVFTNFGQDDCTASGAIAPSGVVFDSATYTGNGLNGPQNVDQNNGWSHLFYSSQPGAITASWNESCPGAQPVGYWGGRVASFKTTAQNQPQPPTGVNGSAVAQ